MMIGATLHPDHCLAKAAREKDVRGVNAILAAFYRDPITMNSNPVSPSETSKPSGLAMSRVAIDRELKAIIADVLGIDAEQADALDDDSGLFGHLPELDSMAIAGLLTEIEDRLDIVIEDDDVDGEMLETYGGLLAFTESKIIER